MVLLMRCLSASENRRPSEFVMFSDGAASADSIASRARFFVPVLE